MTAPRRSVLTFAILGLAVAVALKSCGGSSSEAADSAQAFVRTLPALHASLARLRDSASRKAMEARQNAQRARQAQRGAQALQVALEAAQSAPESLPIVVAQRDSLQVSVSGWESAYASLATARLMDSTRADAAEAGLHQAELHLGELLKARRCHIALVLPCPSRPVAFLAGAVVGVAGYLVVKR